MNSIFIDKVAALEVIAPAAYIRGLRVESIGALGDRISLMGDAEFFGRPYFNIDTVGFAVIKEGDKSVDIVFEREYLESPTVNVSITLDGEGEEYIFDNDIRYVVTRKSARGFTINLNKRAPIDIRFSWNAFAAKNSKTFFSLKSDIQEMSDTNQSPSIIELVEPEPEIIQNEVVEPENKEKTNTEVVEETVSEEIAPTEPVLEPVLESVAPIPDGATAD